MRVIPVKQIINREFPVAADGEFLYAIDDFHIPLLCSKAKPDLSDFTEVLVKGRGVGVHIGENESFIAFHMRGTNESPIVAIEFAVIEVTGTGNADEFSLEVVGPTVVGTHKA